MKCSSWNELKFTRQHRSQPKEVSEKEIVGWDIETVKGKVWLIANSKGDSAKIKDIDDLLNFLFRYSNRHTLNYFFNLKYDSTAMIKLFPEEVWDALYYQGWAEFEGYKLRLKGKNEFSISKHKHKVTFYDIAQFYEMSLEEASSKYLNEHKKEIDILQIDNTEWRNKNYSKIVDYCVNDAVLCQKLALRFHKVFKQAGIAIDKPFSKASIAMRHASTLTKIPRCFFKEYDEYAFKSYHGGRFETLQRGYFPKVWVYDINSAYPSVIADLADLRYGRWIKSKEILSEAYYGFVKCNVTCSQDWLSPISLVHKGVLVFPKTLSRELVLTLNEVKYILKHKDCTIEIIDGWFWIPRAIVKPFKFVKDLYKKRQELKKAGDAQEQCYKTMLNSIYGKFLETRPYLQSTYYGDPEVIYSRIENNEPVWLKYAYKTGNWFNPVYASIITADVRLKVYDLAKQLGAHCVSMFTDSVFSTKKLDLNSIKIGEWSLQDQGELAMLGCGIYTLRNENKVKTRFRGFHISSKYDLIKELPKINNSTNMEFLIAQVISLGKIITQTRKHEKAQLNTFQNMLKELNVNFDHKRLWNEKFKSCAQVLETQQSSQTLQC